MKQWLLPRLTLNPHIKQTAESHTLGSLGAVELLSGKQEHERSQEAECVALRTKL